jgi:hypothetical protein
MPNNHNTTVKLLKQVLRVLTAKLPKAQREKVEKAPVEQIRKLVPYTKIRLAEIL